MIPTLMSRAYKVKCPNCTGKRPERLADHVERTPCYCNNCEKFWVYEVDISKVVNKRVVRWHMFKNQPVKGQR